MQIRKAIDEDIPGIIPLLKKSLGESLMPKSEAFFYWKHFQNPFGPSKIIVAESAGSIIGVRAFMHWKWINEVAQKTAVRAVDTATDPAFQGKGIFTKLTMRAVEECAVEKVDFVFNTPNPVSKIGYLKMGWYENGRLPLYVAPVFKFPRRFNPNRIEIFLNQYAIQRAIKQLDEHWSLSVKGNHFQTPLNYAYLSWRYEQCPVAAYGAFIEAGKFGCIFRLKSFRGFMELRICELWTESDDSVSMANKAISEMIHQIRPITVTVAPSGYFAQGQRKLNGFFGPWARGPIVTLRNLQNQPLNAFDAFASWQPSLGTMELF